MLKDPRRRLARPPLGTLADPVPGYCAWLPPTAQHPDTRLPGQHRQTSKGGHLRQDNIGNYWRWGLRVSASALLKLDLSKRQGIDATPHLLARLPAVRLGSAVADFVVHQSDAAACCPPRCCRARPRASSGTAPWPHWLPLLPHRACLRRSTAPLHEDADTFLKRVADRPLSAPQQDITAHKPFNDLAQPAPLQLRSV